MGRKGSSLILALAAWLGMTVGGGAFAAPANPAEAQAAALMASFGGDQAMLRVFLQAMPKGGDLHNHLSGAIYAEDLLGWAADRGLCIATDTAKVVEQPCGAGAVPVSSLTANYDLYSRAIDALSTRGIETGHGDPRQSGADHFFATFDLFGAAYDGNAGKALAVAREQAAGDDVEYLELQIGAGPLYAPLPKDWSAGLAPSDFAGMLARLQPVLPAAVKTARADLDALQTQADQIQQCHARTPAPGCGVASRFLMSALRIYPPEQVFAELAYGFALVRSDPRVVGVDIVAPEHDPVAIRDYRLHMAMFAFLKQRYPDVRLSLHAGELALGMVAPRDLRFHIHDAVTVAGAQRIGHGVDIPYEDGSPALLRRMASDRVAVEINLTSNAVILGVKGKAHPLALYRAAGVPVALSTDDEGVSRTDMTNEYLRAVTEQGLGYRDLKQIARDSLQYSFAPGESIWADRSGGALRPACAASLDAGGCAALARTSAKAAVQIRLEKKFAQFEQSFVPELRATLNSAPAGATTS